MPKLLKLNKKVLFSLISDEQKVQFPKYVSPFINFLNSVAGSKTDPNHVGQLSELFVEFQIECAERKVETSIKRWKKWYLNNPNVMKHTKKMSMTGKQAYESAIFANWELFKKFKSDLFQSIDEVTIRKWIDDLLFTKTFQGFVLERPIVAFVSKQLCKDQDIDFDKSLLDKSTPDEESDGIDYVYDRKDLNLKFQIKTGKDNENFRNRSNAISKLPDDIYCCVYVHKSKLVSLIVKLNNKEIYRWNS